jgi:hypothetical protein
LFTANITPDAAGVFNSEPFLQNVSKTAITISWETDRAVNPTLTGDSIHLMAIIPKAFALRRE